MIKPLPGYVLIEPIEEDNKQGDLYVPETNKDKPSKGKVVEISKLFFIPKDYLFMGESTMAAEYGNLKSGAVVIYKKFVNQEVIDGDKKYLLVNFSELLAIVE